MGCKRFRITQPERDTLEMIAARVQFRSGIPTSGRPFRNRTEYIEHLEAEAYLRRTADGLVSLTDAGVSEALRSIEGVY